jgi:hypothetical protein
MKRRLPRILGSAGCQPAIVGSLPTILNVAWAARFFVIHSVLGWQPSTAGQRPALPNPQMPAYMSIYHAS